MIFELHARPEEVMRAVEAMQEFGRHLQLDERTVFGLALALEECGSNIVDHAYKRDASRTFQVSIERSNDDILIELRDCGPEFDPTRRVENKPVLNLDERPPGGWGIQLVRHYMDEMEYRRENEQNVLRLRKQIVTVKRPE